MLEKTTRITADLPTELDQWIEEYKDRTGINKNRIIAKALLYYKKNFDNEDLNVPF